jgi:alpha-D-ribose 1-methylphosphonate 5-triphosphate diphosphatase
MDTDRQLVSNGITTACHAVTCSWEPGLRSLDSAGQILDAIERCRPRLAVDTLFHLRHETFNLDAEALLSDWIRKGQVAVLAFNDHMEGIIRSKGEKATKLARTVERTGLTHEAFMEMADAYWARAQEVPGSIVRLAQVAREAGIAVLSHDDRSIDDRQNFRGMGSAVSEFPMAEHVAAEAIAAGEHVVFGAPNVVRGGSHTGCPSAREMVAKGLCTILASDYFYPSLPEAVHCLDRLGILEFAKGWQLVSRNPADALGLSDRGVIAPGKRADLVLARRNEAGLAVVATMVAGRIVMLTEAQRHVQLAAKAA